MPSAPRLLAALLMAAVAFQASVFYATLLPAGTRAELFAPLNAGLGLLVGWSVIGRLTDGSGFARALGHGVRGAAVLLFWALALWSAWVMLGRALKRRYDGVGEALEATLALIAEHAMLLLQDPLPGATLFVGAIGAALVAEWGARRYR